MKNKGYTLVELIIAVALFSFFLLIIMMSLSRTVNQYNAGLTRKKAQNISRLINEDMTRETRATVKIASGNAATGNNTLCVQDDNPSPRRTRYVRVTPATEGVYGYPRYSFIKYSNLVNDPTPSPDGPCADDNLGLPGVIVTPLLIADENLQVRFFRTVPLNPSTDPNRRSGVTTVINITSGTDLTDTGDDTCRAEDGPFCATFATRGAISVRIWEQQ